jgi:hypothetical protein
MDGYIEGRLIQCAPIMIQGALFSSFNLAVTPILMP